MEYGIALAVFVITFLLGSIPWGVIASKFMFNDDVRSHGSGNIGTTNMLRSYGKKAGAIVFLLDFGKGILAGFVAVWAYALFFGENPVDPAVLSTLMVSNGEDYKNILLAISMAGCVWGHIFSPWLNFKGGKGIATAVGNEFVLIGPIGAFLELAIFGVLVAATRFVSLGSVVAAFACLPITMYVFWGNPIAYLFCWAPALTIVWAHRGNIKRLLDGTERRVGSKKE